MGFLKKITNKATNAVRETGRWTNKHKGEIATATALGAGAYFGGPALMGALGAGGAAGAGEAAAEAGGMSALYPLLGGLGGGALSAHGANQATKKQIAWERERATNAHQWEVQDLINAGLNPILSAGGSGAVTGGISAPVPDFSALANSGAEIARIKNENKLAKAEVANKESQTDLNRINTELGELQKELTKAQTATTAEQARKAQADAELAIQTLNAETPRLQRRKKYNESKVGGTLNYVNMAMNDINPAITGLIGYALGGGIKAVKGANTAQKATREMKKNEKWIKSVLQDTKAGQVRLPMIQM